MGEAETAAPAAAASKAATAAGPSGEYNQFMVCGSLFECPVKYAPIKPIGKGAYGIVCSARNLDTSDKVAIKKISNPFDSPVDAKRTLREVQLLCHLKHENIVALRDILPPLDPASFRDVYLVYELMDTDLHQIIASPQQLSEDHVSYFVYQVLRGLKYIHSARVLHRDLKPSNLLVNANCDLKICDFGLARTSHEQHLMTEYVVTRWYRAPELLLNCSDYTAAIDVWSVGCILAELLLRKPLFPGKDYIHQLNLIMKVTGSPTEDQLGFVTSDKARRYLRSLPYQQRVPYQQLWPQLNSQAVDLLEKMLVFEPDKRITVAEALQHPYLAALHDAADEPEADAPFSGDVPDTLKGDAARAAMWREVLSFHPELAGMPGPEAGVALAPAEDVAAAVAGSSGQH